MHQQEAVLPNATPANLTPRTALAHTARSFAGSGDTADVAVVVVTYNNLGDVDQLIDSVRNQAHDQRIRLIVADNASADGTLERIWLHHPDVIAIATGGNFGYAGGINVARHFVGDVESVLVLNPDLAVGPGAVKALRLRLAQSGVGAVVPRLTEEDGRLYTSLRREPTVLRAFGDALFGERVRRRPGAFSEIELDPDRYGYPHSVDWATGAAMLIDARIEREVGEWDEQFFLYSEEIDYCRRIRQLGGELWVEPEATMRHQRGGSGASDRLEALMAVNRVRYYEKWHGPLPTAAFRVAVVLGSILRLTQRRHRTVLGFLLRRSHWSRLPAAPTKPHDDRDRVQ